MKRITVGLVDYGVGNHASIRCTLQALGYRCRIGSEVDVLKHADLLLLPGVGAFPSAMAELWRRGLVEYLQEEARNQRPIVGICLGMQLLADASDEHRLTAGLGLIPGRVAPLPGPRWHIGWNTLEVVRDDPLLRPSDGRSFYFNHSFGFEGATEFQICVARQQRIFPVVIRRGKVLGLQFHPEKSQGAGRELLRTVIDGLCHG